MIHHNFVFVRLRWLGVVNCFQNLLPLWYITTGVWQSQLYLALWIAFRIYYLCDTSQRLQRKRHQPNCCELLSEFITFVIHHNSSLSWGESLAVVNCFQNLLPLWYITTVCSFQTKPPMLWIAFRIYYLCDTSQPKKCSKTNQFRLWIAFRIYYLCDTSQL